MIRRELIGRKFTVNSSFVIPDTNIIYTIEFYSNEEYTLSWLSTRSNTQESTRYDYEQVHRRIDNGTWALLSTQVIEEPKVINDYSIGDIEAALNDIPWLEGDDAKELLNELTLRLGKKLTTYPKIPTDEELLNDVQLVPKVEDNQDIPF